MALPDKHQLKFNTYKDAKTLMEAIEKWFGGNKKTKKVQKTLLKKQFENFIGLSFENLDQIHDRLQKLISQLEILGESISQDYINLKFLRSLPANLKIYEAEVKSSSSASTSTPNIAFVSSQNTDNTTESVSAVTSVTAASAKVPMSVVSSVDTLSDAMAMLTIRARRFLQRTGRNLGAIRTTSIGFDMSKVECYNCHKRGHFARECSVMVWEAMTGAFRQKKNQPTMHSWHSPPQVLLVLIIRLGYDTQVFTSSMFNYDEMLSSESDVSLPASPLYDRYHSGERYHVVPLSYTGTFMPPKPDLVFHDAPIVTKTVHAAFNVKLSPTKPDKDLSQSNRSSAPIIEDWVFDSKDESKAAPTLNVLSFVQPIEHVKSLRSSVKIVEHPIPAETHRKASPKTRDHRSSRNRKACFVCKRLTYLIKDSILTKSRLVSLTAARPVNATVSQPHVTKPRPVKNIVTKSHSPPRRTINRRPYPKPSTLPQKVTTTKTPHGNPQHALQDKRVIDSGCPRHMTGNMSYLSNFESINGGYVAFGGNLKGGKITDTECIVLSSDFKLPTESHVLLRVPRENNMYNVDLKNIVPLGDLTCLFAKATLDESNFWHRRLGHINFKTINKLVKDSLGKFNGKVNKGFLVGYSITSKAFGVFNSRTRIVQETLHINFLENKPNVAGSGPAWLFDIDTFTKFMNYQPVSAGVQHNPSAYVQDPFDAEKAGEENVQQYDNEFEVEKPESEVHVSPSSSAKTKKHDDKTKREAKGKIHVELSTGVRKLIEEFKDFTDNSTNKVNDVSTPVLAVGQNSTNSTNTFSAAGPFNTNVFRNKKDERGIVVRNKALLVAQRHTQEEGIDCEEFFAPVARIEAIRLFLAYASFMGFIVYQMDVKSAFLYGTIKEEVYVCQPLGFEDPNYPDKVYKVVKALYGLHQAPRAWYETLANYLLENGFQMGKIDQTLFIKRQKDRKSASTSIDTEKPLLKDSDGDDVDVHTYRSMIGSLMYLTSSRPDIMFTVCACARFQVTLKVSHLHAVKRIFRYLKGKPHLGLWYPKDSLFNLVAYSDSDYAGASLDRKSTTEVIQSSMKLLERIVYVLNVSTAGYITTPQMALIDRKKVIITEDSVREALHLDNADSIDCLPNEEIFVELARMGKTAWNEFSSSMALAVICLSTESLANMRRVGKGFSGVETPLFEGMIVARQDDDVADDGAAGVDVDDVPAADAEPTIPSSTSTTHLPPPSQEQEQPSTSQAIPTPSLSPIDQPL
nr:hypothetical protein [Tanacetum cinerariifolium]